MKTTVYSGSKYTSKYTSFYKKGVLYKEVSFLFSPCRKDKQVSFHVSYERTMTKDQKYTGM